MVTLKAADRNIEVMRPYLEAAAASGRSQVAAMGWTRKPSGCSSPASVTPLPANARNSPSTRQPAQWRPRRGWRGRRSMWRRRHCPVGVGGVGASDAVAEVPLDPRQRGVPYPVHADLRRPRPWRMPADAGPEMVIAAAADPPPIGMPEQLPVARRMASPACWRRRAIGVGETGCQRTVSPFSRNRIRHWSGSRSCGRRARAPPRRQAVSACSRSSSVSRSGRCLSWRRSG